MKKFIIIQNMKSRGRSLKRNYIESLLNKQGVEFELFQTHNISELENVISNYKDSSKYQYCTIGGDGSLNALVNTLFKNEITLPSISCLPAGSGSDFIRIFGLPQKFEENISRLNNENYYEIDVGVVKNENQQKYFLNVLNIGFLASTVNLSEKFPNFFKRFRYPLSFWLNFYLINQLKLFWIQIGITLLKEHLIFVFVMDSFLVAVGIFHLNQAFKMVFLMYSHLQ